MFTPGPMRGPRELRLKLVADDTGLAEHLMVAYDTSATPTVLPRLL